MISRDIGLSLLMPESMARLVTFAVASESVAG